MEIPIDATTGEAREISVEVDVQVDPATGAIIVQTPSINLTSQVAPASSVAQVVQGFQQIVEAVAIQVFSSPSADPDAPAPNEAQQPPEETPPGDQPPSGQTQPG